MASQRFCLRWNNHQTNLLSVFDQLLHTETFIDVTLAVEGQYLKAHKVCKNVFTYLFVVCLSCPVHIFGIVAVHFLLMKCFREIDIQNIYLKNCCNVFFFACQKFVTTLQNTGIPRVIRG